MQDEDPSKMEPNAPQPIVNPYAKSKDAKSKAPSVSATDNTATSHGGAKRPAASSDGNEPTAKKRGRPPGAKNKTISEKAAEKAKKADQPPAAAARGRGQQHPC